MRQPAFAVRVRAQIDAMRQPDDPVDRVKDGYPVRLRPEQMHLWEEGADWCREHIEPELEQWSRRIDTGGNHDERPAVPMFTFSHVARAAAFRCVFY